MEDTAKKQQKKQICVALVAHVDAGKTTLSESFLYKSGKIRKAGRVDHKDAFLDTYALERDRGITIFSKQAEFSWKNTAVTLLDTPGHVDFSAEMERTLPLLDYAVLIVNGADGVQGHTKTLWYLLKQYQIPSFLFVNKMDQNGTNREQLRKQLQQQLGDQIVDFTQVVPEEGKLQADEKVLENIAVNDEMVMEHYLETGTITISQVAQMVASRQLYPCFFGSALQAEGVTALLDALDAYTLMPQYQKEFAARIYKIARDEAGERLTYVKVTGGTLHVKDVIAGEKVNQIRIYSGAQYESRDCAAAGTMCAVTGLRKSYAGQGLGSEKKSYVPKLSPVLNYRILLPEDTDVHAAYLQLKQLEEEEPLLHISWEEKTGEIRAALMGTVQCEIIRSIVAQRYGMEIAFGKGEILYKETVAAPVEGVGHFEPLRHYAEVHVLLEPGEPGSGLQFDTVASEDVLDRNWQRLILTHLQERVPVGVLTGAELTDVKITVLTGRAHKKHTEGGDFRQATYRAVRQGLKRAQEQEKAVLLEPVYAFTLVVPADKVGRAMADIQRMHGSFVPPVTAADSVVITGKAPASQMQDYAGEVVEYTRGMGSLSVELDGYEPCHNAEEVIAQSGYDSEADVEHPTASVFCAHGAGFIVPWYEVEQYMHVESPLADSGQEAVQQEKTKKHFHEVTEYSIDQEELEEIFTRTFAANQSPHKTPYSKKKKRLLEPVSYAAPKTLVSKEKYLLVDGYNIIFAWPELKRLSEDNLEGARNRLMQILSDYQAYYKWNLILVFDAYKVKGNPGEVQEFQGISVVYTKEAETADQYIEKVTHRMGGRYDVTVATSDALEQLIVTGHEAKRISARELLEEITRTREELREKYLNREHADKETDK